MKEKPDEVTLCAVGDVMLGDSPKMLGRGVRTLLTSYDARFDVIRDRAGADLVFGNLEGVLSDAEYDAGCFHKAQLRGSPEQIAVLKKIGINIVSVANNHMMQYGCVPFNDTCELLAENDIAVVGRKGETPWLCQPVVKEVKGVRVGFLAYADPDNYGHPPLYALTRRDAMLEDIKRLRPDVDKLVLSIHWGDEFVHCPSPDIAALARSIMQAGADLILGHHPHVIQDVIPIGRGWCCYSLGNFISDMIWNERAMEGLLVSFSLKSDSVELARVDRVAIGADFVPVVNSLLLDAVRELVDDDQTRGATAEGYRSLVRQRTLENRNLSHLHLLRSFYRYRTTLYLQIWANSFKSVSRSVVGRLHSLFR